MLLYLTKVRIELETVIHSDLIRLMYFVLVASYLTPHPILEVIVIPDAADVGVLSRTDHKHSMCASIHYLY